VLNKLSQSLHRIYHGKKGITGLETAIILIAFVTVAAVLAYTVLSAGIFSSERGKEAVYGGLNSAQSTMTVKGAVIGKSLDDMTTMNITFTLALALSGSSVDLNKLTFKYHDSKNNKVDYIAAGDISFNGTVFDGTNAPALSGTGQVLVTVTPDKASTDDLDPYDTFTLEIIPPTGASITIQRTLPGSIEGDIVNLS
jgi:archaeal flagellin FlaB